MSLASAIFSVLSNDGPIALLIDSGTSCRAYPSFVPAGTAAPYAMWQHIGSDPQATHDGPVGIQHDLVQVMCFARTYAEAVALRGAIVAALDGVLIDTGMNPTLQDERDSYEEAVDLHRCDADFLI